MFSEYVEIFDGQLEKDQSKDLGLIISFPGEGVREGGGGEGVNENPVIF